MSAPSTLFGQVPQRGATDPVLRARDERVEALKAVVGKLAHDFNNFLVPQFGYLTLINEEIPAETSSAQYLKTMESAARTTERYIESVLLAVRPQRQYAPKDFDLGGMLTLAIDNFRTAIPNSISLEIEQQIEPAPIHADERHWSKLIEHLLSNAKYALVTGGKLTVSLRGEQISDEEILRLGLESGDVYCLSVNDTGFGIPAEVIDRVFEPFFTSRAQHRGSGLGLTVVHTVAHFHGGQVELVSEEDRGTTVTVWIPRVSPTGARSAVTKLLRQKPVRRRKLLMVEDDAATRDVLRPWLSAMDFEVQSAESAGEVEKLLSREPSSWSLILAEAVIGGQSTAELGSLAARLGGIPIIFLTRDEGEQKLETAVTIKKPVSLRALRNLIYEHARARA